MAESRKSAKKGATKKRAAGKRRATTTKKTPTVKKKSKKKRTLKTTALRRRARKGLKAARGGLDTVIEAGGKTWKTLKTTTTQMVEGVKDTLGREA